MSNFIEPPVIDFNTFHCFTLKRKKICIKKNDERFEILVLNLTNLYLFSFTPELNLDNR